MERKKQIFEAGQKYLDSMDEFQRYHTYPKGAFIDGAKWADEHPKQGLISIDKACEWLESALRPYVGYCDTADIVESFRKAMKK